MWRPGRDPGLVGKKPLMSQTIESDETHLLPEGGGMVRLLADSRSHVRFMCETLRSPL